MSTSTSTSTRIVFELSDYCPSCGVDVADHLFRLGDVHGVDVDLASGRVQVEYDASRLDVQDLLVTIGGSGAMARPVRG
ncbi:Copper chaperone CopZ [Georgenia satyanarayanai]|uniref:Copper chaperone CopZ n=1 Tax=Georgenia satyanarayanai TaxID=860221 RepID=A0A2Y9AST1_9MICO|nr:heavy metal-associated domain-containing protein [Georgenia satyanarayanai]PYF95619.1 copper chaperone CopZ [Georgenia satyanarayanai]SSA47434.1 Copper chaperone CopZ [Georgenia satyanarayanai]